MSNKEQFHDKERIIDLPVPCPASSLTRLKALRYTSASGSPQTGVFCRDGISCVICATESETGPREGRGLGDGWLQLTSLSAGLLIRDCLSVLPLSPALI